MRVKLFLGIWGSLLMAVSLFMISSCSHQNGKGQKDEVNVPNFAGEEDTANSLPAGQLLKNGDFSQISDDQIVEWIGEPRAKVKLIKVDERHEGKPVARFTLSSPGELALAGQTLATKGQLNVGDVLSASAWVRSYDPEMVSLLFRIHLVDANGQGKRQYVQSQHPGDGQWHKLEISWTVTQDLLSAMTSVDLDFWLNKGNTKPFEVSDASATLMRNP